MIWWEVVLLAAASAALVDNGLVEEHDLKIDFIQEQNYLNTYQRLMPRKNNLDNSLQQVEDFMETDMTTEQDDLDTEMKQEQVDLTAGVLPSNDTGLSRISEKKGAIDQLNSRAEQRKEQTCSPTSSCTLAGGYCFKAGEKCNGTVDSYGCLGGKHCICCIPDNIICGPASSTVAPTTTSVTTTAATTTTTPAKTTDAPTTTTPVTTSAAPTTPTSVTTTAAPTTQTPDTTTTTPTTTTAAPTNTTRGCNVTWLSVGADRFVSYHLQKMNWADARNVCRQHCLDLYEPKDALALSQYLDDTFSIGNGFEHWLGGRGNGTHQIWFSGNVVPDDAPWYSGQKNNVATEDCMFLHGHNADTGSVLGGFSCDHTTSMRPLCG